MPVKISANPAGETDVRAITLDEFNSGRINFNEHYSSVQTGEVQGQIVPVRWTEFDRMITDYVETNSGQVAESQVAVSFIHCYNLITERLYYRIKLSKMTPTPDPKVFSLVAPYMWFDVREDMITPCEVHSEDDVVYMNEMQYHSGPEDTAETLSLNPTIYVKALTLPWKEEIKLMWQDNGSPIDAMLNLASCSYMDGSSGSALVEWPHGIVLYLSVNGQDLLNNGNYFTAFNHKGADMSTQCPPMCNLYIVPAHISQYQKTV